MSKSSHKLNNFNNFAWKNFFPGWSYQNYLTFKKIETNKLLSFEEFFEGMNQNVDVKALFLVKRTLWLCEVLKTSALQNAF